MKGADTAKRRLNDDEAILKQNIPKTNAMHVKLNTDLEKKNQTIDRLKLIVKTSNKRLEIQKESSRQSLEKLNASVKLTRQKSKHDVILLQKQSCDQLNDVNEQLSICKLETIESVV